MKRIIALSFFVIFCFSVVICQEKAASDTEKKTNIKYGKVTIDEVFAGSPDWREKADEYVPQPAAIDYLSQVSVPVKIEIYYGHWCGDSVNNIPKFIKVMETAANPAFEMEFWSVERMPKGEKRGPVNGRQLKAIPTFVVFVDSKECGEIVENPEITIEDDLVAILSNATEG